MNNDVHLQALIEKSLQLKIIQYKYPEHDIDIRWAADYFKTRHIRWAKKPRWVAELSKSGRNLTLFGNHIIFQGTRFNGLRNCKMISMFKNNLRIRPILAVLIHSLWRLSLFSFRLARRNVITKRNENWAWSQLSLKRMQRNWSDMPNHLTPWNLWGPSFHWKILTFWSRYPHQLAL